MKEVLHKPLQFEELKRIILLYHYGLSQEQLDNYLI